MRIISGKYKSRHLKGTPPPGIRPTSDKLRETLFNILGDRVHAAVFLDGCAGVGAIGIEAISRGAELVYFVDQSRKACQIIRQNLTSLEILEGFRIMEMDLMRALRALDTAVDIAFIDPPYDHDDMYANVLQWFGASPRLRAEGLLIFEHSKRKELPESSGGMKKIRSLVQGDAALAFYSSLGES
jgi:16S rRNA (guanine(966)-N(2))-methyltransferase RsmD